jgi:tRNA pseudouridine38-40 synthase
MCINSRYFLFLSYKGTFYHGWQLQPNSITVQKILDEALSVVLNEPVKTIGAGRTDTGVHAIFFCAHFDSKSAELASDKDLIFKLNRYLPNDIAINSIRKVQPGTNARFSAVSRTYKYYISKVKDPFFDSSSWFLYGNFDVESMNAASATLLEFSDFTSFSRLHSGSKTNNCIIYHAGWEETQTQLIFTIKADRFLRNMVRSIVGSMTDIGFGKINIEDFKKIILARDRGKAGMSAPAKGLFLTDIEYPPEIFI